MVENKVKTQSQKLIQLVDTLPECCYSFLLETGTERALSTRISYARELKRFFDWLILSHPDFCIFDEAKDIPETLLSHITSQDISRYTTQYKDEGHKERSTALKRNALSAYFGYMVDNRKIEYNPVVASAKIKIHTSDTVIYLNIDEQNRFMDAVYNGTGLTKHQQELHERYRLRDIAMVSLMLDTGMRVSELCGINLIDVSLEDASVIVTRKGGNLQTLYYSDDTKGMLDDYIEYRRMYNPTLMMSEPLFVNLKNERLTTNGVWRLVTKYASAALPGKGDKISPHKLRSSFAMELYRAKQDILLVQRSLGHKNLTATNIYAKATDAEMRNARNVLADIRASR